jgi:hypothetical protein
VAYKLAAEGKDARFIVLTRDPLAAKISALLRFCKWCTAAAFKVEVEAMVQSLSLLAADTAALPCERTLFLGYELLTAFPQQHRAVIAAFLGVHKASVALDAFLASVQPCSQCDKIAERWNQTGALGAEVGECSEQVHDGDLALGKKMHSVKEAYRLAMDDGTPCASAEQCQKRALQVLAGMLDKAQKDADVASMVPTLGGKDEGDCYKLHIMRELAMTWDSS